MLTTKYIDVTGYLESWCHTYHQQAISSCPKDFVPPRQSLRLNRQQQQPVYTDEKYFDLASTVNRRIIPGDGAVTSITPRMLVFASDALTCERKKRKKKKTPRPIFDPLTPYCSNQESRIEPSQAALKSLPKPPLPTQPPSTSYRDPHRKNFRKRLYVAYISPHGFFPNSNPRATYANPTRPAVRAAARLIARLGYSYSYTKVISDKDTASLNSSLTSILYPILSSRVAAATTHEKPHVGWKTHAGCGITSRREISL